MGTDPGLERLQRWMQACILQQGTSEEAISCDDAQAQIPADVARGTVLPSKTLTALERLDIYRDMFVPRMEEALAIDYPALKHFLGAEAFMRLVARYVEVHPSRSYTLNDLGANFPRYLRESRPQTGPGESWPDFIIDLAMLEWTGEIGHRDGGTVPAAQSTSRAHGFAVPDINQVNVLLIAKDLRVRRDIGLGPEDGSVHRI